MQAPKLVIDNRINVSGDYRQIVRMGGRSVVAQQYPPASSATITDNGSINFNNINIPAQDITLTSRAPRFRYTLTNTTAAGAYKPAGFNPYAAITGLTASRCLRGLPLQSACNVSSFTLNGNNLTINSRQVLPSILRRTPLEVINRWASDCPLKPDRAALTLPDVTGQLTSNQTLSSVYNSDGTNRGSFMPYAWTIGTAGPTSGFSSFFVSEPIMCSPFTLYNEENYLANLNTMAVQLTLSNITDMTQQVFSAADAAPTIAIDNLKLELYTITVDPSIVSIPPAVYYDYEQVQYYTQSITPFTDLRTATSDTITFSNIRFNCMPKLIYFGVRPNISNRDPTQAEAYAALGTFKGVGGEIGRAHV